MRCYDWTSNGNINAHLKLEDLEKVKNKCNKQKTFTKIIDFNPNVPVITYNVSGLNTPVKIHQMG